MVDSNLINSLQMHFRSGLSCVNRFDRQFPYFDNNKEISGPRACDGVGPPSPPAAADG